MELRSRRKVATHAPTRRKWRGAAVALVVAVTSAAAVAIEAPAWARGGNAVEPEGTSSPAAIKQALSAGMEAYEASPEGPPAAGTGARVAAAVSVSPAQAATSRTGAAADASGGAGFNPFTATRPSTLARDRTRAVDDDGDLGVLAAVALGALACIGWLLRRQWTD